MVQCNDLNQAVGEEAGILGKFLGMIARNGSLCSLGYTDLRYVIGKREKNTNELKVKKDILKQVKVIPFQINIFANFLYYVMHIPIWPYEFLCCYM